MKYFTFLGILGLVFSGLTGCDKDGTDPAVYNLDYGDSILYLKNTATDYIVFPQNTPNGTFTGFPEGIELDPKTGAINVSKSETGLRYRIIYTDAVTGKSDTSIVLISGINYFDQIYNLSNSDTLALPVYNASTSRTIPVNSVFDEGNGCNGVGVSVNTGNAVINLADCIRNGVFGNTPKNGETKEVELKYRVNDGSGKTLNTLKVKLYYYNTAADIDPVYIQLLKDREGTIFGADQRPGLGQELLSGAAGTGGAGSRTGVAKPRPPCIFIVGR